jgi:hypothetical protein
MMMHLKIKFLEPKSQVKTKGTCTRELAVLSICVTDFRWIEVPGGGIDQPWITGNKGDGGTLYVFADTTPLL